MPLLYNLINLKFSYTSLGLGANWNGYVLLEITPSVIYLSRFSGTDGMNGSHRLKATDTFINIHIWFKLHATLMEQGEMSSCWICLMPLLSEVNNKHRQNKPLTLNCIYSGGSAWVNMAIVMKYLQTDPTNFNPLTMSSLRDGLLVPMFHCHG